MAKRPKASRSGSRRPAGLSKALGLPHKSHARSSKRLASVSHEALRRASPAENVKMGFSPKARRYVKTDARKITKATASVSARQAETKRVRKYYGVASPEIATKAREHGALSYRTAQTAETASKTKQSAYLRRLRKAGQNRQRIVGEYNPDERHSFKASPGKASRVETLRGRKLRGEFIEDQNEWFMMIRFAEDLADPALHILRSSVNSDSGAEYQDE
jgi:hypothetical protein